MNNFFNLNVTRNNIEEASNKLTLQKSDNFDDIKQKLKEEFIKDSKNEAILKIKNDELLKLKNPNQQLEERLEKEKNSNANTSLIAR